MTPNTAAARPAHVASQVLLADGGLSALGLGAAVCLLPAGEQGKFFSSVLQGG